MQAEQGGEQNGGNNNGEDDGGKDAKPDTNGGEGMQQPRGRSRQQVHRQLDFRFWGWKP